MNQRHHLYPEHVTSITVDGKSIPVISLPKEIQNEISVLNMYADDYATALIELEKAGILLKYKKSKVEELVKAALQPVDKATETNPD